MDKIGLNWIKLKNIDKIGQNWAILSKLDKPEKYGQNWTKLDFSSYSNQIEFEFSRQKS